jgi:hypothetical protein
VPVSRAALRTLRRSPCLISGAWLWIFELRTGRRVLRRALSSLVLDAVGARECQGLLCVGLPVGVRVGQRY